MARRRDTDPVSFDVSFDADDSLHADAPGPTADRPGRRRALDRWRARTPRQRRRAGLLAGGLVVVVVGGLATTTAVTAHADAQRLREAPGGVLSLEGTLTETQRVDADDLAAVLPDGVLALVDGADVVAWDVASGDEVWRTEVGRAPRCGPRPQVGGAVDWATPVATITCLHDDGARVSVLTADGDVTGTRDLPADEYGREHQRVAPAADGGLVVAEVDLGLPERVEIPQSAIDDPWAVLDELERPPTSGTVHVEDALTGDVRFEVPLVDSELYGASSCYDTFVTDDAAAGGSSEATLDAGSLVATPHLVLYEHCGTRAAATASGTVVEVDQSADVGSEAWFHSAEGIQVAGDGEIYVPTAFGSWRTGVGDGPARRSGARLVAPSATDGSPAALVVGSRAYEHTVALDPAGEPVWSADGGDVTQVVQTSDTVVVVGWEDVVGRDAADGAERWRFSLGGTDLGGTRWSGDWSVVASVTDGTRLLLLVNCYTSSDGQALALVTVDLATGELEPEPLDLEVRAAEDQEWGMPWLVAVDGRPALVGIGFSAEGSYTVPWVRTLGTD